MNQKYVDVIDLSDAHEYLKSISNGGVDAVPSMFGSQHAVRSSLIRRVK